MNSRTLCASSLVSKFGFMDGAILGAIEVGYGVELPALLTREPAYLPVGAGNLFWDQMVLAQLVRTHLLPLLPGIEIYEIGTSHNPVRIESALTDEQMAVEVVITAADVEAAAKAVEAQWAPNA